jgi:hypothetical protein
MAITHITQNAIKPDLEYVSKNPANKIAVQTENIIFKFFLPVVKMMAMQSGIMTSSIPANSFWSPHSPPYRSKLLDLEISPYPKNIGLSTDITAPAIRENNA